MSSRCWAICSGEARSVLVATATLMVRRTFASSETMKRSPGPIFSLAGKHTATTSTSAQVVLTRSLSRSPSSVRGRCRPGVSTRISWASGRLHDAAHDGARGLRLVAGDHHLLADHRVGQRGLAGVRPAHERHEAAAVGPGHCIGHARSWVTSRAASYAAQISSSDWPAALPARQMGPGSTARGWRVGATAPVAHHVVRRARQAHLPHQVLADRPHLRGLPRHPEVALAVGPLDGLDDRRQRRLAAAQAGSARSRRRRRAGSRGRSSGTSRTP